MAEAVPVIERRTRKVGKKGETRRRIIRSATRLFATNGYAATSIAAICQAAGVVPTSIYWEFGSKAGVLEAVLQDSAQRWRESATKGLSKVMEEHQGSGDPLDAYFDYRASAFTKNPDYPRLMLMVALERGHRDRRALEIIRAYRQEWITSVSRQLPRLGLKAADPDGPTAYQIAELTFACLDGAFISAQIDPSEARLHSMFDLLKSALQARLSAGTAKAGSDGNQP